MSRMKSRIVRSLAPALLVAAVVAPSASASERTATELGQSTGPPAAIGSGGSSERTATELGQSTNLSPSVTQSAESSDRTATELGQSTNVSPAPAPSSGSSGFDSDDVAIVGAGVLGLMLIGIAGMVLFARRRGSIRKARAPAVSS